LHDVNTSAGLLNLSQIQSVLDAGVAATVAYARRHSPFYRQALLDAPAVKSTADLAKLPLTTKSQVSQFNDQFFCGNRKNFVDICTTSGTTGLPTLYPLTASDLQRLGSNEAMSFAQTALMAGDVVLLAVTIDKCFMAGLAYYEGLRQLGCTAIRVGAGSPAMLLGMTDRLKPRAIVSVPSFLKRVAEYAGKQGIDPAQSTVRKLVCIGEPVRDTDFNLTPMAAEISRAWNAEVYSTYGITELACSLCECTAGQGGHLHPTLMHIEVIDDQCRPLPDGQVGQLVATSIGVQAMPLIRFATGDMTFIRRDQCRCGRWTPRIGPILGRRDQQMKLKGTTVYPAAVQRALQSIPQINDYVMIATAPSPLSDELEVLVSLRNDLQGRSVAEVEECIRECLRGELKVTPGVRITTHAEIASLGHGSELRKQRVFVDRRG
jgi:phenylacetate-CoA ligase